MFLGGLGSRKDGYFYGYFTVKTNLRGDYRVSLVLFETNVSLHVFDAVDSSWMLGTSSRF